MSAHGYQTRFPHQSIPPTPPPFASTTQHQDTVNVWPDPDRLIEAHGRLGLFKCIAENDTGNGDDEDDSDDQNGDGGDEGDSESVDDKKEGGDNSGKKGGGEADKARLR